MSELVFHTPRLAVRRWRAADLDAVYAVYSDAQAMRWVGDGQPIARADCERWMEVTFTNYAQRGYGMFALEELASGAVLGFAGLVHPGGHAQAEVKYALRRDAWGQGYATEAVIGLLAYGAGTHRLAEIVATTAPENLASHRVLLKAGMQRGALQTNDDGSQTQCFFWRAAAAPDAPVNTTPEAVVREFWRRMASNDFHTVKPLLSDDFVLEWPQSKERIRGAENFARMNSEYPSTGRWQFHIHRLVAQGDTVVTHVGVSDGTQSAEPISFFTVDRGRIVRLVEYWPEPFAAAEHRRHLVEPMT